MRNINVAIAGLGTVGGGLLKLIQKYEENLQSKYTEKVKC